MAYYRTTDRSDRAKALGAVLVVHLALGAAILSGLNVRTIGQAAERLQTFAVDEAPPPPRTEPPPPPPVPEDSSAPQQEAAPANIESRPTPVVAPDPQISLPIPLPMSASETPAPDGADATAGTSDAAGAGSGGGGEGSGYGGGGSGGTGSGAGTVESPARLVRNLTNRDYRGLAGGRLPAGRAAVRIRVGPDGRASNCRIAQSSGDPVVDSGICELVTRRLRFRPATDAAGRPVASELTYIANWRR